MKNKYLQEEKLRKIKEIRKIEFDIKIWKEKNSKEEKWKKYEKMIEKWRKREKV